MNNTGNNFVGRLSGLGRSLRKPHARAPQGFLFCTQSQWLIASLFGLMVGGMAWPWYAEISVWIGVVLFLITVTVFHMLFTFTFLVPYPHIAILITGLQYVLAAWFSFYYPPGNPIYDIGARLPVYLSYAGWVMTLVCLGWALPLWGLRPSSIQRMPVSAALLAELDVLFWIGMASTIMRHRVSFGPLNFVLVLSANLRYLGAIGRMLVFGTGWQWRIVLTLALEVLSTAGAGMFHDLLLWSALVFAIYIYKATPRKLVVVGLLGLGVLVLPALQQAKVSLRERISSGDSTGGGLANVGNAIDLSKDMANGLTKSASGDWDSGSLGDIALRYNQGWIINRVMQNVPSGEPYAKGETLLAAVEASLLPRVVDANKVKAGGQENMRRFAGYALASKTSMNLGYAGEMYANFGYWGGIAGCFFYALILGLLIRWVAKRAAVNPLWWALVPYVGQIGLKAEEGIAEVLNWIVKATVVSAVIYYAFPAIRAALSQPRRLDQRVMPGNPRFSPQRPYLERPNFSSRDWAGGRTAIRAGLSEARRGQRRLKMRNWRSFRHGLQVRQDGLSSPDSEPTNPECE
jgi:hypothetical protein